MVHLVLGDAWRTVCGLWADAVEKTNRIEKTTCEKCQDKFRAAL
jgi:hypothetical protein